jgi:hypothetical protein
VGRFFSDISPVGHRDPPNASFMQLTRDALSDRAAADDQNVESVFQVCGTCIHSNVSVATGKQQ